MVRLRFKNGVTETLLGGNGEALVANMAADGLSATITNLDSNEVVATLAGARKAYTLKALRAMLVAYGVTFKDEVRQRKQAELEERHNHTGIAI